MRTRALSIVLAVTILGACGSSHASGGNAGSGYPTTLTNCGSPVTFTSAPARAVSNDINTTEDMLALGLGPRMVGDFGVDGDGPVPAPYLAPFRRVHDASPDYFTLEQLVALHPDFVFAGWDYGFQVGSALTPGNLAHYGIKTLALTESCAQLSAATPPVSIDDTYQDLRNLGAIFNVRATAAKVIASMQTTVASVQAKVAHLPPVSVFDYDSGESAPFTAPGLAMPDALIALAGGRNIFAGLHRSWTSVSWEQVVAANPQCILINDYGTPTAAQKKAFLETSPITKNLAAVRNKCVLALPYDELTPSPRNPDAVAALARWLHPAAFTTP